MPGPGSGYGSSSATFGRHRISAWSDLPLDAGAVAEGRPAAQTWVEEMPGLPGLPELPARPVRPAWEDTDDWAGRSSHTDPTIPRSKTEPLVREEVVVGDFGLDSLGCFPVPALLPWMAAVSLDG